MGVGDSEGLLIVLSHTTEPNKSVAARRQSVLQRIKTRTSGRFSPFVRPTMVWGHRVRASSGKRTCERLEADGLQQRAKGRKGQWLG